MSLEAARCNLNLLSVIEFSGYMDGEGRTETSRVPRLDWEEVGQVDLGRWESAGGIDLGRMELAGRQQAGR
jgi:hypothetical protein